jgi:LmbE family N-acetylglucosaminyl deacetylase
MRLSRLLSAILLVPTVAVFASAPSRPTLTVDASTRLLLVSPHPDDETLAAGGLMQKVVAAGGELRVVYLTDGEGFPAGVQAEEGRTDVKPSDYREYGRERKDEARAALRTLGVRSESLTFLGFPNGGLSRLLTVYWSDRRPPYQSPYTRRDRPRPSEILEADTRFHGEDLTQELATIVAAFRPTMILTPRKEDQHVDHCAAWFFTADALGDVARIDREYRPDLVTYIVHFESWPWSGDVPNLPGGRSGWLRVPLTKKEQTTKLAAIHRYKTQMKVMDWFLEAFALPMEVFSRPATAQVVLPLRRSPCDQFKS